MSIELYVHKHCMKKETAPPFQCNFGDQHDKIDLTGMRGRPCRSAGRAERSPNMATDKTGKAHTPGETTGSATRGPQQLRGPLLTFDLAAEAGQLRAELTYQEGDRNANTLLKEQNARVVLTALRRGARLQEHQTAGWVVLQTITGRIRLRALGQSVELPAGHLLTLEPNAAHEVEALEESVFLLTLAWSSGHGDA